MVCKTVRKFFETLTITECTLDNCCGTENDWGDMWNDLSDNQRLAWINLGWNQSLWNDKFYYHSDDYYITKLNTLEENRFCWKDASFAQKNAIASLCYTSETWDRDMLQNYELNCGQLQTKILLRYILCYF